MEIKNFNEKRDLDFILSTFEELHSYNIDDWKPTKLKFKKFKESIVYSKNKQKSKILVLILEKIHVGYIQFSIYNDIDNYKILMINKVFILKNYRKNGYAKKLIDEANFFANKMKCDKVALNTFPINFELYKKLGFEIASYRMEKKV